MKIILITFIALIAVLFITNPGQQGFDFWYQTNIENPTKMEVNNSLAVSDSDIINVVIQGIYSSSGAENGLDTYLNSIKEKALIKDFWICSIYQFEVNNQTYRLLGILKHFFQLPIF